ncbi:MAG: T9SS type A sorting domain-containing protein [Calditrichaeota bacterium]|nr:T9SS type A sorting domain-containing protein [Calditrichota bacterium]
MMNSKKWIGGTLLIFLMLTFINVGKIVAQSSTNFKVKKNVLSEAGSPSNSSLFKVDDCLGQASPVGASASANFSLSGGFLAASIALPINPTLSVNPTTLNFTTLVGTNPPTRTFTISNASSGSFNWSISDDMAWLTANPTSGTTSTETDLVTVTVNSASMTAGTYTGTITVTAPGADGSPVTIAVTLTINQVPPNPNPPFIQPADASGAQGSDVTIDININSSGNGNAIDAFGFQFTYDNAKFSFVNANKGNLTQGWANFNAQENSPGVITVGGFNVDAIPQNSQGSIAQITLRVNQCTNGETSLVTIQNLTDDLAGFNIGSGTFTCTSCLLGDVNNDGNISPGDALCAFQIYLNGGTLPSGDCDNPCALYAADVNCTPNGITPGDALYIFQGYMNGDSAPLDCNSGSLKKNQPQSNRAVSLIQIPASRSDELKIVLKVSQIGDLRVFGANIGFPDDLMQLVSVKSSPITELWEAFGGKESIDGVITVGGFHTEAVERDGDASLAEFTFRLLNDVDSAELWLYGLTDDLGKAANLSEEFHVSLNMPNVQQIQSEAVPQKYSLSQNYPNPFNMATDIRYSIPEAAHVTLVIYNARGQRIKTLVSEQQNAGYYAVRWNGKDEQGNNLPSGVYVFQMKTEKFAAAQKLVLIK